MEASLKKPEQSETKYTTKLNTALEQYRELATQAVYYDAATLASERHSIRPAIVQEAVN